MSHGLSSRFQRIAERFVPPHLAADVDARRRAIIVVGFALVPIPLAPVFAAVYWFLFDPAVATYAALGVLCTAPFCLMLPFVLRWTGSPKVAAHCQCTYAFLLLVGLGVLGGGRDSPAFDWLLVMPLTGLALTGPRGGGFWLVAAVAWYGCAYALWSVGVEFQDFRNPERLPEYWLVCSVGLALMVFCLVQVYEAAKDYSVGRLAEANAELSVARDAAQAASHAKSAFLANVSHEVRTPMTAILGFADVLLEDAVENPPPDTWVESIETIQRNAEQLLGILNDILDLSKIEAGQLGLELIEFSLAEILDGVVELMRVRVRERPVELRVEIRTPIPRSMYGDPTRLRQVMINLIGNAIKFTAEGSVTLIVECVADAASARIDFAVEDTGIGMNADQAGRIFEPFSQADASTTRRFGGTGLGLAISNNIVTAMGGELRVDSVEGQGSRFSFTVAFPLPDLPEFVESREKVEATARDLAGAGADARPENRSILLVDDGPDNRRLISHLLRQAGWEVSLAENGREALEAIRSTDQPDRHYAVVLMDMRMPILDGYETTRILRREGYARPIIALTANTESERDACLQAGCDDFLSKPVDVSALRDTVARLARGGPRVP